MFPVTDPAHNLFEITKQLVLLEAHLNDPPKRCPDCITKHFLSTIGYAEELPTLDHDGELTAACAHIAPQCQELFYAWAQGGNHEQIGSMVRYMRKNLQPVMVECCKRRGITFTIPEESHVCRQGTPTGATCNRGCA